MPNRPPAKVLLSNYDQSLAGNEANKKLYLSYARRFLKYAQRRELDRAAVLAYMEYLRKQGYADGTIAFIFRVIGRLFRSNGIEWPFRKGEGPRVRKSEEYTPALHPVLIRQMIKAAYDGLLEPGEAAYLALSTIYGLRKTELLSVTPEDINLDMGQILIKTAKHGREWWHSIPKEIRGVLGAYSYPKISDWESYRILRNIEYKSGIEHTEEVGWHAIRRTVVMEVGHHCSQLDIHNFFRWKADSTEQQYTNAQYVGLGPAQVQMASGDKKVDDIIFAQHPFLLCWRGEFR